MLGVIRRQAFVVLAPQRLSCRLYSNASSDETAQAKQASATDNYYDVVICGGGMVGTAMARALGRNETFKNLKIALIESSPEKKTYQMPSIHSNRVCALNNNTVSLLKSLDSFDFIQKHRYGNVHHMHVWDASSDASISFKNDDASNLAVIVENDLIQASLSQNLNKLANLKVMYSKKVKDFSSHSEHVELHLDDDSKLVTKLLIASDGPNSFIRQKAAFSVTKWDYDQIAIVATLKLGPTSANLTAWQRFLSTGPIALLPLNDQYSSLVWSIKKKHGEELTRLSDDEFVNRVNHAFVEDDFKNDLGYRVEKFIQDGFDLVRNTVPESKKYIADRELVGRLLPPKVESATARASYPLGFTFANNYVKDRIALIGDSAHRIHPLAGQGVNLGFGDVSKLVSILSQSVQDGADLGSWIYLKKYETERQKESYTKILGVDALNRLYTDVNYPFKTPLVALRTIGLTISNRVEPLKSLFVKEAMN